MTNLLILTKTNTQTVTVDIESYTPGTLTPRIARKAAVFAKAIPCLVTDGFVCYRVTSGWVVIKDINNLKHGTVLKIIDWMVSQHV